MLRHVAGPTADAAPWQVGFPCEDIIFDPNVLTIATGLSEHDNYGKDFSLRKLGEPLPPFPALI